MAPHPLDTIQSLYFQRLGTLATTKETRVRTTPGREEKKEKITLLRRKKTELNWGQIDSSRESLHSIWRLPNRVRLTPFKTINGFGARRSFESIYSCAVSFCGIDFVLFGTRRLLCVSGAMNIVMQTMDNSSSVHWVISS